MRNVWGSHRDLAPSPWLSHDGRSGSSRGRFKVVCYLLDSLIEKRYGGTGTGTGGKDSSGSRTCVAHKDLLIEFRTSDSENGWPNCGGTRTEYYQRRWKARGKSLAARSRKWITGEPSRLRAASASPYREAESELCAEVSEWKGRVDEEKRKYKRL